MATTLAELRATGFGGVIVIVNYYSLDYSDSTGTGVTELLNRAIAAPAKAYGAVVADVFSAFQKVVANPLVGGKTCNAGFLMSTQKTRTYLKCAVQRHGLSAGPVPPGERGDLARAEAGVDEPQIADALQ